MVQFDWALSEHWRMYSLEMVLLGFLLNVRILRIKLARGLVQGELPVKKHPHETTSVTLIVPWMWIGLHGSDYQIEIRRNLISTRH